MPPKDFSCLQCGHCCLGLGSELSATAEDVALWEENGRDDILAWVDEVASGIYDIWIHPRTGEDVKRCPWLRKLPGQEKFICRIQDMKPEVCRNYPVSRKHAESTGCKGL
jgi:Fe-S-cluster containining protein